MAGFHAIVFDSVEGKKHSEIRRGGDSPVTQVVHTVKNEQEIYERGIFYEVIN